MSYPLLNKLKNKKVAYPIAFVCLLLVLSGLIPSLRRPVLDIIKHPLKILTLIRREIGGIIFYHQNLVQVEKLKKETGLLRQKLTALNDIDLENKRLKELFAFKQNSSYKVIAARVIARSPDNWSSLIVIDKGRRQGIKQGMAATSYLGLIGRVVEAAESTSKVMLINDPDLGVSAIVQRSRQEGLVCGTLGSSLMMKYLSRDSDVKIQDLVVTSGLTGVYPKGLPIGTVVDIGEEFSGLARYAIIKPAVNLSNIEEVLIIVQ